MHRVAFLLALLIPALSAGQGAAVKENPFVGSWVADISKSRLSPAVPLQSATLQIAVAGDTVSMASTTVIGGQEQNAAETFRSDGTETPGTINPGIMLAAKWVGSHVLASIATKNGQVFALVTYEVSADGKTLTSRSSGMIEQVIVFERK